MLLFLFLMKSSLQIRQHIIYTMCVHYSRKTWTHITHMTNKMKAALSFLIFILNGFSLNSHEAMLCLCRHVFLKNVNVENRGKNLCISSAAPITMLIDMAEHWSTKTGSIAFPYFNTFKVGSHWLKKLHCFGVKGEPSHHTEGILLFIWIPRNGNHASWRHV